MKEGKKIVAHSCRHGVVVSFVDSLSARCRNCGIQSGGILKTNIGR